MTKLTISNLQLTPVVSLEELTISQMDSILGGNTTIDFNAQYNAVLQDVERAFSRQQTVVRKRLAKVLQEYNVPNDILSV